MQGNRQLRLHHIKATSGKEKHKVKIPLQTVMPDVPELRQRSISLREL